MNPDSAPSNPQWALLAEQLIGPIGQEAMHVLNQYDVGDLTLSTIPLISLHHFLECYETASEANLQGRHAVALGLLRQALEALSIAEIGISRPVSEKELISLWFENKKNVGYIRKVLEVESWPKYGAGLWDEPWSEFWGNLSKVVHPYAHFSGLLLGWRYAEHPGSFDQPRLMAIGFSQYDPLKASRVTLLWSIVWYALARIISSQAGSAWGLVHRDQILEWGTHISKSKLLFKGGTWDSQLLPHMMFKDGTSWRDE